MEKKIKEMTRKEFESFAKANNFEVYTQRQVYQFSQDILKSEDETERLNGAIDYASLNRVVVVNDDLSKSVMFYREQQVEWDKAEDGSLMKARAGVYKDTPVNRKKGIVGMRYGATKKPEGVEEKDKKGGSQKLNNPESIKAAVKNGSYPGLKDARAKAIKSGYSQQAVDSVIRRNASWVGTEADDESIFAAGKPVSAEEITSQIDAKKESNDYNKRINESYKEKKRQDKEQYGDAAKKVNDSMKKLAAGTIKDYSTKELNKLDTGDIYFRKERGAQFGQLVAKTKDGKQVTLEPIKGTNNFRVVSTAGGKVSSGMYGSLDRAMAKFNSERGKSK